MAKILTVVKKRCTNNLQFFMKSYFDGVCPMTEIERFHFAKSPAHGSSSNKKIVGLIDSRFTNDYTSHSGKNILAELTKVQSHLHDAELDLLGPINRAYQLELWDEFHELLKAAKPHLSDKAFKKVEDAFDLVPA